MKCRTQPLFLRDKSTPITEVWEVRLPKGLWQSIVGFAKMRKKTFSTITRLCIFQLAERASLRWHNKLQELHAEDIRECREAESLHRHMVCFYGEDVRMVRLAAMELGLTVSAFIRLALRMYLRYFAMEKRSKRYLTEEKLFWRAIKRYVSVRLYAWNQFGIPTMRRYFHQSFPPEWRWGWPQ